VGGGFVPSRHTQPGKPRAEGGVSGKKRWSGVGGEFLTTVKAETGEGSPRSGVVEKIAWPVRGRQERDGEDCGLPSLGGKNFAKPPGARVGEGKENTAQWGAKKRAVLVSGEKRRTCVLRGWEHLAGRS